MPVWIVAFSGHRPISKTGRPPAVLQSCRERLRLVLLELQGKSTALGGRIELFTSAAAGDDQIAIEVAESMGLAIHIILPLPILEFAEDFRDHPQTWDLTLAAIAKAGGLIDRDEHFIASLCDFGERKLRTADWPPVPISGWTFRISDGVHERDACYYDCVTQQLEAADALIVLRNEPRESDLGETLDVLEQAQARGIAIAVIDSTNQQPAHIDWKAKPWATDPIVTELNSASGISKQASALSHPIESVFSALDENASRTGGRLKNRVTTIIALQFSAAILAAINSALLLPRIPSNYIPSNYSGIEFKWDAVLIAYQIFFGCELAFVVLAFLLGLFSRRTNLKSTWRQNRFAAEVLRSLIYTRGLIDPLYPLVSRHNPIWHRFALSSGLSMLRDEHVKAVDWELVKSDYHHDRIEHQREAYFRKQLAGASKLTDICGKVANLAGTLAPICLMFAFYLKFAHSAWISTSPWSPIFIKFLPILLPLLAGTATSLKVVTDAGRRAERYKIQADRLHALSDWFRTLKTPSSIRRAVVLTEEILLDELIEWHVASKNTGK